jgi:four helix bundle protein
MKVQHYRQLVAWQKAMDFAESIYRITKKFPRDEIYGITSQLRRAAVSIPSNIAEGQGRWSSKEFVHFLGNANGSLQESETQVLLAHRLAYIDEEDLEKLLLQTTEVGRIIHGLSGAIRRRNSDTDH